MIKYTEYKYHLAALFSVAVWGATFVSTKVLIANSLTPAEIFLLRFAMAYLCIPVSYTHLLLARALVLERRERESVPTCSVTRST